MLEPLIVLTVLNCFFMFSSTVTTCALWWQYRSHRCCFRKCAQQTSKNDLKKASSCGCRASKRQTKSKLNGILNIINTNKSNTTVDRQTKTSKENKENRESKEIKEIKDKKAKKRKSKTNLKYLSQLNRDKSEVRLPANLSDKGTISEASQTNHENKSTVVMEYSTVQKIVQVVDDDGNLPVTGSPFKTFNSPKDALDKNRKVNFTSDGAGQLPVLPENY